jgi:vancomycin permeability regulator SanA
MKRFSTILAVIFCFLLLGIFIPNLVVLSVSNITLKQLEHPVAIVFGAKTYSLQRMSPMLEDRVLAGIALYKTGKVAKILFSGDHGSIEYDEVNAMRLRALDEGVKPEDIFLDHAGFDTYDTLYRAKEVFQVENAFLVSQSFHLPRAVFIGRELGLQVQGISADSRPYTTDTLIRSEIRELFSRVKAFLDTRILHSIPKYLGEPIPISGDGRLSWDS